ncbi:MAG: 4-hydroxy-3-methylbut-2-en-1-yl diphosphate synthase [Candidatus Solincola sediminis]|uniref:4-hydroxy-3-methylbut-2-en-1-yl diphosphate synthase (flavodoxin) n=1 Tax=Candidatus Solincola sediminis TaxID=1797199 RepID=A0A1F2WFR1_9ACTN|nr:MAG: 4-hydroxy-3-methylbut-2-en-1-yl diphosphate synthase [Candidatus Solincola sediminis]OFW59975.1 MAG: 4-hydroxy-3-methylbut-2-en-1-yl diphosphate synthase [Candidatus Solincola sediminis]
MTVKKLTRRLMVGDVRVGGGAPISIQSMTNTDTRDAAATLDQIRQLADAGCQIVRVAVPATGPGWTLHETKQAITEIVAGSPIPVVGDVHFDYTLALAALEAGVQALRINPGNIGVEERVKAVAEAAGERGVPIRVGVNAGSLEKEILSRYGHPTAEALVESALKEIGLLERYGFQDIKVSVKSSSVPLTLESYRLLSERIDYPLHVGVSEAGPLWTGTIRSSVGIGTLLAEGIGDTIRVSLAGDPLQEVRVGRAILKALELSQAGADIIACPTCARTQIDVERIASELEERLRDLRAPIKIAIMGCAVNGPGEAVEADLGVAGGKTKALLFKGGKRVGWYAKGDLLQVLLDEVEKITGELSKKEES